MKKISSLTLESLMQEAIIEAKKAALLEEVPVGAVIAYKEKIIARAHNLVEVEKNSSRHAEIIAIERASKILNNWRLNECILAVTLEPCTMCAGAIKLSRIPTVVYGCHDERLGAFNSVYNLAQDKRIGPVQRVISGVYQEECRDILKDFFKKKRLN